MFLDDKEYKIEKVYLDQVVIFIETVDNELSIHFGFINSNNDFDIKKLDLSGKTDITNKIYWDVTLKTKDTYYLFDISKDKVYLTRINDNKYKIEVEVNDPDMIYSPSKSAFKSLKIRAEFTI